MRAYNTLYLTLNLLDFEKFSNGGKNGDLLLFFIKTLLHRERKEKEKTLIFNKA